MHGASINVHFHGPVNAPVTLKIDAKAADLLDVSDDEGHGFSPPVPKVSRREIGCGFAQRELRKMTVAERTRAHGGELQGLCNICTQDWRPLFAFIPSADSLNTIRRAAQLEEAIVAFHDGMTTMEDEDATNEAYDLAVKLRTSACRDCQHKPGTLNGTARACKEEFERMKRQACHEFGGCPIPGCPEKGIASWICLSGDHKDMTTKVLALSDYTRWFKHGGVEGMRKEWHKVWWPCWCCHMLLPSSNAGRGRKEKTFQCYKDQDARVAEKEAYVNAVKLRIGRCQYPGCGRLMTPETVRAFAFDHRDEKTKATYETHPHVIYKCQQGGVGSMVSNTAKHAALELIKDDLDAEMDKCDLLCHNCHICRKPRGRARWDES